VEEGKRRLAEGMWVLIFPEGTRMPPDQTRKYGVSGALLAARAGCQVLPIAHDAGFYWPRRGWMNHPGQIRVVIGPPIDAAGRDPRELNDEVRGWLDQQMQSLLQDFRKSCRRNRSGIGKTIPSAGS